jgi:hypothetical protein
MQLMIVPQQLLQHRVATARTSRIHCAQLFIGSKLLCHYVFDVFTLIMLRNLERSEGSPSVLST